MASQQSFSAIFSRFKDGNTLVQSWGDYGPQNVNITKAALTSFIADVTLANKTVDEDEQKVGNKRATRNPLVFEIKDTNPTCLETRLRGIFNYLDGDEDNYAFVTASKKINTILKKIRPKYPKKDPAAPRGAGKSPMEKSFASAVGYGNTAITIITTLGVAYAPVDTNLSVANMTTLVGNIETENGRVQIALDAYGVSQKARLKIYKGPKGLEKRRSDILKYLSSFPGLKKNDHYIEYNNAIKGT